MGSKRKRVEKKKDFVKAKLKVGKTAAKPDNYTDTSFTARSIVLPNQSIKVKKAGSENAFDLAHHLSLTRHHSSATRKEVLLGLEKNLPNNPSSYKDILTTIIPLITDSSKDVRLAVISLLNTCADKEQGILDLHLKSIVLFVHSAMTHIKPEIRITSTKYLSVLLKHSYSNLYKAYFFKTLRCYFSLLSWTLQNDKKSISFAVTTSTSISGPTKAARAHHLDTLQKFLESSLLSPPAESGVQALSFVVFPHAQSHVYQVPGSSQPFSSLGLFERESYNKSSGMQNDSGIKQLDTMITEDISTRREIFREYFMYPMKTNLSHIMKEGGEVGRAASSCLKVLNELQDDK